MEERPSIPDGNPAEKAPEAADRFEEKAPETADSPAEEAQGAPETAVHAAEEAPETAVHAAEEAPEDAAGAAEEAPETAVRAAEEAGNLKGRIEAILFVAGDAVELRDLSRALLVTEDRLEKALDEIESGYEFEQRGFMIKRFGSKVQLATRPLYADDVVRLLQPIQKQSLGQGTMETLAVIAYRQPVTRGEIEAVRGVKCDYSVQNLLSKGLIQEVGRKDTIGRPVLFGTTDEFLSRFGLETLEDLPPLPEPEEEAAGEEEGEKL